MMSDLIAVFYEGMYPRLFGSAWQMETRGHDGGGRFMHKLVPFVVIVSAAKEQDGKLWVHFSMSHKKRLPDWDEFKRAKDLFLGDVCAYMVFPTKAMYVNIHPYVLHLFHCLDGELLPDFTNGTGSI